MRIKVIADVHGDLETVRREAGACDVLLLLGDLVNIIDYERGTGVLADVYGSEAVRAWSSLRAQGRFDDSRAILREVARGREEEMRALLTQRIDEAHKAFCCEVPSNVIVTYGNVDIPDLIRRYLPSEVRFVDGDVLELEGVRFGFIGGGLPKVGIPGEVKLEEYERKVRALGPVDVLCAHVPPALDDLTYDVVADLHEPGSEAILEYLQQHEPEYVYFGHVHQPRVDRMRYGRSTLINVGCYYRTTGTAIEHPQPPGEGR